MNECLLGEALCLERLSEVFLTQISDPEVIQQAKDTGKIVSYLYCFSGYLTPAILFHICFIPMKCNAGLKSQQGSIEEYETGAIIRDSMDEGSALM